MNKPENYFYEYLEKQNDLTDEDIEKYVDEHFEELINCLIRRIARVVMNTIHKNE